MSHIGVEGIRDVKCERLTIKGVIRQKDRFLLAFESFERKGYILQNDKKSKFNLSQYHAINRSWF